MTIDRVRLDDIDPGSAALLLPSDPWRRIAERSAMWAASRGVVWRDAVVVVPFLELLAPARRAFASLGGWMPTVATTRTLTESLGPVLAGDTGFDAAVDTLFAAQLMAREPWGADWSRRDRRGFERGAARVVETARALGRAAAGQAPPARAGWWHDAREQLRGSGGPGGKERLLAQLALEWAAAAPPAASDRLFALRPAAWIVVEAGGPDALVAALLAASAAPRLLIDADPSKEAPFAPVLHIDPPPSFAVCESFEDEASAAAAQVLEHLRRGERPVALVAEDRVLVRRIRALLERHRVRLADETGWKLSTTRAGASLMALLAAARPTASTDAVLDWLKAIPPDALAPPYALSQLESACRRNGAVRRDAMARLALDGEAARLRDESLAILREFAAPAQRGLPAWLDGMRAALDRSGALGALRHDEAGRQALAALGIEPALPAARRQAIAGDMEAVSLADFTRWVDDVFERVAFRPATPGPEGEAGSAATAVDRIGPDVVVTPLARAMLRPFAALVLPGADGRRLGAAVTDDSLLPGRMAEALGLPTAAARREAELLAFAQALRLPRVTLLRRRGDASALIAESPLVERLRLALAGAQRALRPWVDPRVEQRIAARPLGPGAPVVPAAALPQRLSASAYEALRACPYRFFARSVLGLGQAEELDDAVEKRDYGTWLHEVLHAFHLERRAACERGEPAADRDTEVACLLEAGESARCSAGIDEAAFLPFAASFRVFAPRYVAWLHAREQAGWVWSGGEEEHVVSPAELGGVELYGRIDRIDRRLESGRAVVELIDYKTGSAERLRNQMRDRFEDTQLAFYAALVGAQTDAPLRASYLAVDGSKGLVPLEHLNATASGAALVENAASELRRLRAGAGLPALGAGSACDYCDARGLCRRDHWTEGTAEGVADEALR